MFTHLGNTGNKKSNCTALEKKFRELTCNSFFKEKLVDLLMAKGIKKNNKFVTKENDMDKI